MGQDLRVLGIVAKWVFIVCLPVLLLGASIAWAANSLWLYEYGSHKYGVSQTLADAGLELADTEVENIYAGLIRYFNSADECIRLAVVEDGRPVDLFTAEEIIHFRDVKGLIWLDYWLVLGTLTYALVYFSACLFWRKRRYWRYLAWGVVGGSGTTLALMAALWLGARFGFGQLFYGFHLVFFRNPFWSAQGYMLLLFPEPFFHDAVLFCAGVSAALAIILGGIAGGSLLFSRKEAASL